MVGSASIRDGHASLDGDLFNHMVRVLRLGSGAAVTLVDEHGTEHKGVIDLVGRDLVDITITSVAMPAPPTVLMPRLTICQALPKGEKTELILQKGTELGVHDFWLFGGLRSVARVRDDTLSAKLERWNRVTSEAARQCGRPTIPGVSWFPRAGEAAASSVHDLRLLLWEEERTQRLKSLLDTPDHPASAIVAIGPEGGIDPREAGDFAKHGFQPVSLGRRILRTETAALAIAAILQYTWGDI
jgi:16S rRNA (uracil1498-N3)-methyltransferase